MPNFMIDLSILESVDFVFCRSGVACLFWREQLPVSYRYPQEVQVRGVAADLVENIGIKQDDDGTNN